MKPIAVQGCEIKYTDPKISGALPVPVTTPSTSMKAEHKGVYFEKLKVKIAGITYNGLALSQPNPLEIEINGTSQKSSTKNKPFLLEGDTGKYPGVVFKTGDKTATTVVEVKITKAGQTTVKVN